MKFIQIASLATAFFTVVAAQWDLTTCEGCTKMCWEASGTSIQNPIEFKWRFNAFSLCRKSQYYANTEGYRANFWK